MVLHVLLLMDVLMVWKLFLTQMVRAKVNVVKRKHVKVMVYNVRQQHVQVLKVVGTNSLMSEVTQKKNVV